MLPVKLVGGPLDGTVAPMPLQAFCHGVLTLSVGRAGEVLAEGMVYRATELVDDQGCIVLWFDDGSPVPEE